MAPGATSTASIGGEVEIEQGDGSVTIGGTIDWGTNTATTRAITWDDGTVERQMGGNTGSATIELTEIDPPGDAPPTRTFTRGNTALGEMESTAMAMAFNGGQPVNFGGQVNFRWTVTEADAMDLRDDARAYVDWFTHNMEGSPLVGQTPPGAANLQVDEQPE